VLSNWALMAVLTRISHASNQPVAVVTDPYLARQDLAAAATQAVARP